MQTLTPDSKTAQNDVNHKKEMPDTQRQPAHMADGSTRTNPLSIFQKNSIPARGSQSASVNPLQLLKPTINPLALDSTVPLQMKIRHNKEWYSFQSNHDENGNPYLLGHGSDQKKQIAQNQPGIVLEDVDSYTQDLNEDTKQNLFRNLEYGRGMEVKTKDDVSGSLRPFKSYNFKPETPYEVAYYDQSDKPGKLYPAFEDDMLGIYNSGIESGKYSEISTGLQNSIKEMRPLIYGEDYRTDGANLVFEGTVKDQMPTITNAVNAIKGAKKKDRDGVIKGQKKEVKKAISLMSSDLPWAGTKGKTKFKTSLANGDHDDYVGEDFEGYEKGTSTYGGIKSPIRESEEDIVEAEKPKKKLKTKK